MYRWTEQSILWHAEAVAYMGFDRKLADVLQLYLPPEETVYDLGCGMGYLALELARRGYKVTAVDYDVKAIRWLRLECNRRSLSKLNALEQD